MQIEIDPSSKTPIYKQLISSIKSLIQHNRLQPGDELPSMNQLSSDLEISKETVKKAYYILRDQGMIEPAQGKGFYVSNSEKTHLTFLVFLNNINTYK